MKVLAGLVSWELSLLRWEMPTFPLCPLSLASAGLTSVATHSCCLSGPLPLSSSYNDTS